MNIYEYNFLPTIPLNFNDLLTTEERDLLTTEERNLFEKFSNLGDRAVYPINQDAIGPVQKTSVKVHDAQITWKGNIGSPSDIWNSLDKLERMELCAWQRPEMLDQIAEVRPLVILAVSTFEEIQSFANDLRKRRNELRKMEKTPEVANQLELIKRLIDAVQDLKLPEELTQETVEQYTANAQHVIEDSKKQLEILKAQIEEIISTQNAEKQRLEILKTQAAAEVLTSLRIEENVPSNETKEPTTVELPPTELAETPQTLPTVATEISPIVATEIPQTVTSETLPTVASEITPIETPSPVVAETPPAVAIETPLTQAADEQAGIAAIAKSAYATIEKLRKEFGTFFEKLEREQPDVKENLGDLLIVRNNALDLLEENTKLASTLADLSVCVKKIDHYEAVNDIILNQIRNSVVQSKKENKTIGDCGGQARALMSKEAGDNLGQTLNARYDAIAALLEADNLRNNRWLESFIEEMNFFEERHFDKVAGQFEHVIQLLKQAQNSFKPGDSLEKFDDYRNRWNEALEVLADFGLDNLSPIKDSEKEKDAILSEAYKKKKEWESRNQWILASDLQSLLNENPTHRVISITFNGTPVKVPGNDAADLIRRNADFCADVEEFLDYTKENSLIDVIEEFEEENDEIVTSTRKQYLLEIRRDINEMRYRLKSIINPSESLQKLDSELQSLLTHFEVSNGWFKKEQLPLENLSSEILRRYEAAVRAKLSQCNKALPS